MRKAVSWVLTIALSLSMLTACGGKDSGGSSTSTAQQTSSSTSANDSDDGGTAIKGDGGDVKYEIDASVVSSAPEPDKGGLAITDSMIDTGIMRPGNVQRLADVLVRASKGEAITLAFVGGSATNGDGASSPEKGYAQIVKKWWDDTFPKTDITMIDLGMSGQDSYIAAHRITKELLPKNPDVVFVETALSDGQGAYAEEAFEGMARQILSCDSEPALIPIVETDANLTNHGATQAALAMHMNLPLISPALVIKQAVDNGTWKWTDLGESEDSSNLNDAGHALTAFLVITYCKRVLEGIDGSGYTRYTLTDDTKTSCRYMNGKMLIASDISGSGYQIADLPGNTFDEFKNGWVGISSDTGEFTIKGKNIGIVWYKTVDGNGGDVDIFVDGTKVRTRVFGSNVDSENPDKEVFPGIDKVELGRFDNVANHTISLTKNAESTGTEFFVVAFLVSGE